MSLDYQVEETLLTHPAWVELSFPALANNIRITKEHLRPSAAAQRIAASGSTQTPARIMAVVKADAYGHGLLPFVGMLQRLGVTDFAVAQASEALFLARALAAQDAENAAANTEGAAPAPARIFTWMCDPLADLAPLLEANIEVAASTQQQLQQIGAAAAETGRRARVYLKIDTGMARAGATMRTWEALCERAFILQEAGQIEVVGVWSHLARADELDTAGRAATKHQEELFDTALAIAQERFRAHFPDQEPQLIGHLAASGGIFYHPHSHHEMVRVGISMYGYSPNAGELSFTELGLEPVLALRTRVTMVKRVPAGTPVSYGGTWVTPTERWLALVPVGYADGIMRSAAGDPELTRTWLEGERTELLPQTAAAFIAIAGKNYPIVGRICMDQMVVDLGPAQALAPAENDAVELAQIAAAAASAAAVAPADRELAAASAKANAKADLVADAPVHVGEVATIIGADPDGPTADTWAGAAGTINHEVLSALTPRLPRIVID